MKNLFWLLILCSTLAVSCDYYQSVDIINETSYDVSVEYFNDLSDSTSNNNEYYINNPIYKRSTGSISKMGSTNAISDYINEGPEKKLYLYVFKTDTVKKYKRVFNLNELIRQHKYYQLNEFSEEQLKNADWKIRIY